MRVPTPGKRAQPWNGKAPDHLSYELPSGFLWHERKERGPSLLPKCLGTCYDLEIAIEAPAWSIAIRKPPLQSSPVP